MINVFRVFRQKKVPFVFSVNIGYEGNVVSLNDITRWYKKYKYTIVENCTEYDKKWFFKLDTNSSCNQGIRLVRRG